MSKQFDNNMRGVLFKNDRKEKETQPDYTGSATIEGVDYFMDAWLKSAETGRKFFSFSFKAKNKQQAPAKAAPKGVRPPADWDDEQAPF